MNAVLDLAEENACKIHFMAIAKEFKNFGHEVEAILPKPSKIINKGELTNSFDRVFWTPSVYGGPFSQTIKGMMQLRTILTLILKEKLDIFYSRFHVAAPLFCILIKFARPPLIIISEHDGYSYDTIRMLNFSRLRAFIVKRLQLLDAKLSDKVRVVTEGIKHLLVQNGVNESKIFVVGNSTDIDHFRPVKRDKALKAAGLKSDFYYIGFIGYLAKWQGVDFVLRAAPMILKEMPQVRFLVVGDGPEYKNLRFLSKKLGIEKECIFTGSVPYKLAPVYINSFDIAVAPFTRERNEKIGLSPLKIRDYAACGIPIVASKVKGLEMVEENNIGVLVNPEDEEKLANAIIFLLKNPEIRKEIGQRARELAERELSWKKTARKILNNITLFVLPS